MRRCYCVALLCCSALFDGHVRWLVRWCRWRAPALDLKIVELAVSHSLPLVMPLVMGPTQGAGGLLVIGPDVPAQMILVMDS